VALPLEAACLDAAARRDHVLSADPLLILVGGMGTQRAEAAARRLLQAGAEALLSWGTAGALAPALPPGTLLLPERILHAGTGYAVSTDWRRALLAALPAGLKAHGGNLLHSDTLLATPAAKTDMHAQTGADSVDMESGAVAAVARQAGVPFLTVRVVVDGVACCLPPWLATVGARGELATALQGLRAVARHPGQCLTLLRLALGLRAARRTLRAR